MLVNQFKFNPLFAFILLLGLILQSCSTESTPMYTLTTETEPDVAGTVTQSSTQEKEGGMINITAIPNEHWLFTGWAGDISGTNEPVINVYMDKDRSITALFEKVEYPVTINIEGEGEVTREIISSKSVTEDHPHASILRLDAIADQGWKFSEWVINEGSVDSQADLSSSSLDIEVEGPSELTAIFVREEFQLRVIIEGEGNVTREESLPAQRIEDDDHVFETMVKLTATAASGWQFDSWGGDASGNDSTVEILIDKPKEVSATFVTTPSVETRSVTNVTETTAITGGNVTSTGGKEVTERGVCVATSPGGDNLECFSSGAGLGNFTTQLTDLLPGTTYYVTAYAKNAVGTKNATNQESFTTIAVIGLPTVQTTAVSSITSSTAISGGNVINAGGLTVTQRGVCVGTNSSIIIATALGCTDDGTGTGSYSSQLSGLSGQTTYYARAFATNNVGTAYGSAVSFTTEAGSSTPTTPPPSSPPPASGTTQVALIFLDGVNLDVTVNGTLYSAGTGFDYTFNNNGVTAGVKVVTVTGNLTTMQLNPNQLKRSGLNSDGFGLFTYKVVNKNSTANLYGINALNDGNAEFWGKPAFTNPLGIMVSRLGDTVYSTKYPDPLFYLGWRYDPVNHPNDRNFQSDWSKTGKMAFSFFNLGKNSN